APIPYKQDVFPTPEFTRYMDPRFVKIILPTTGRQIYAKIYTVAVDIEQISSRFPGRNNAPHPLRGKHQVLLVGYETTDLSNHTDVGIIDTFQALIGNDVSGEPYITDQRAIVNFGLRKGIVFLATE
ncbi:MAG: hypothetical protein ABIK07_20820, partial [Planctomycetota bacterium]